MLQGCANGVWMGGERKLGESHQTGDAIGGGGDQKPKSGRLTRNELLSQSGRQLR